MTIYIYGVLPVCMLAVPCWSAELSQLLLQWFNYTSRRQQSTKPSRVCKDKEEAIRWLYSFQYWFKYLCLSHNPPGYSVKGLHDASKQPYHTVVAKVSDAGLNVWAASFLPMKTTTTAKAAEYRQQSGSLKEILIFAVPQRDRMYWPVGWRPRWQRRERLFIKLKDLHYVTHHFKLYRLVSTLDQHNVPFTNQLCLSDNNNHQHQPVLEDLFNQCTLFIR